MAREQFSSDDTRKETLCRICSVGGWEMVSSLQRQLKGAQDWHPQPTVEECLQCVVTALPVAGAVPECSVDCASELRAPSLDSASPCGDSQDAFYT